MNNLQKKKKIEEATKKYSSYFNLKTGKLMNEKREREEEDE
jgi:hypothetical protein